MNKYSVDKSTVKDCILLRKAASYKKMLFDKSFYGITKKLLINLIKPLKIQLFVLL